MKNKKNLAEPIIEFLSQIFTNNQSMEKAKFMLDANSFEKTAIIIAAHKLGIFNKAITPLSSKSLAASLKINPIALERLLTSLASQGYLVEFKGKYRNTLISNQYLNKKSPDYLGEYLNLLALTWNHWNSLSSTIKTGKPNKGMSLFSGNKEVIMQYYLTANEIIKQPAKELIEKLDLSNVNRLIAGEVSLTFIKELLNKNPKVQYSIGCLRNQKQFLKPLIKKYSLPNPQKIHLSQGHPLKDSWGSQPYDLVFLYRKLAYAGYGEEFLKKSYQMLNENGVIIILEPLTDSTYPATWLSKEIQLMDMLMAGSKVPKLYSSSKIKALLKKHRFRDIETISTSKGSALFVVGRK